MNIQPSPRIIQGDYQKFMIWGCAIFCLAFCCLAVVSYMGIETFVHYFLSFFLFIAPLDRHPEFRRPMEGISEFTAFWLVLAFASLDALVYFCLKNRDTWFRRFFYPDKALEDRKTFASMIFGHFFIILMAFCLLAGTMDYLIFPNNSFQRTGHTTARR